MKSQTIFYVILLTLMQIPLLAVTVPAATSSGEAPDVPEITFRLIDPEPGIPLRRIHPPIPFRDKSGKPVTETDQPLSLMVTCGSCHDTAFIARHNYHSLAGMDAMSEAGKAPSGRSWDTGAGLFGRFDPLLFRVLSPDGGPRLDMGTADWIMSFGARHVGGGPAEISRFTGTSLTDLLPSSSIHPDTHIIDPATGIPKPWDWQTSGTVELNCLLCHIPVPNNAERIRTIRSGRFNWASTATLAGTGLVTNTNDGYRWNPDAFDTNGQPDPNRLHITDPGSTNCRMCHGNACRCVDPVVFENSLDNWLVETSGEVFSPDPVNSSGMNLKGKQELSRPWDIHAQRLLGCTSCHYSPNNPTYRNAAESQPEHLTFDARRMDFNDYLTSPDHDFVKGHSAQGTVARHQDGTMRSCRDCHAAEKTHDFLPFKTLHFEKLTCQSCHIREVIAPVRESTDWTVLTETAQPIVRYRGVQGPINDPASLIEGFQPMLLFHEEEDRILRLKPHNLITSFFWVEGDPAQPVRLVDLKKAYFTNGGAYHADILTALDADRNGMLNREELRLDSDSKVEAIARRLKQIGVDQPRISGEIQPYSLSHGVATGPFAMRDCTACHSPGSRITRDFQLAAFSPAGTIPRIVEDSETELTGDLSVRESGELIFHPTIDPDKLYLHGAQPFTWMDLIGIASILAVTIGAGVHGGLRVWIAKRRKGSVVSCEPSNRHQQ